MLIDRGFNNVINKKLILELIYSTERNATQPETQSYLSYLRRSQVPSHSGHRANQATPVHQFIKVSQPLRIDRTLKGSPLLTRRVQNRTHCGFNSECKNIEVLSKYIDRDLYMYPHITCMSLLIISMMDFPTNIKRKTKTSLLKHLTPAHPEHDLPFMSCNIDHSLTYSAMLLFDCIAHAYYPLLNTDPCAVFPLQNRAMNVRGQCEQWHWTLPELVALVIEIFFISHGQCVLLIHAYPFCMYKMIIDL